MKFFAYHAILKCVCVLFAIVALNGCQEETTVKVTDDGENVTFSIPQNVTAANLMNAQTALTNTLTMKAERERMAFQLKAATLQKQERQYYALLICISIVTMNTVTIAFIAWKIGGKKS